MFQGPNKVLLLAGAFASAGGYKISNIQTLGGTGGAKLVYLTTISSYSSRTCLVAHGENKNHKCS